MCLKVAIVYNEPLPDRYHSLGEGGAISGVVNEVAAVLQALISLGHEVSVVPLSPPLSEVEARLEKLRADLVFNLFEGFGPGSEAEVARILESKRLCFTGSPGLALARAEHKAWTKLILLAHNVPTPDFQVLSPQRLAQFRLSFPCIVKPLQEDASHGLSSASVVGDFSTLAHQVNELYERYGNEVLVEEFLPGREFNATVIGARQTRVFPPSEIVYTLPPGKPQILTYSAKWDTDDEYFRCTQASCPAEVHASLKAEIKRLAVSSFRALGCRGYARVDMRQNAVGELMVLEVNPNPDISPDAGALLQAKAAGLDYTAFISEILSFATNGKSYSQSFAR